VLVDAPTIAMSAETPERSSSPREVAADPPPSLDLERARRAGGGEPAAQAWLVVELLPAVRKIARALARSPADADDAAQLAMIAILKSAATYRGEASLQAWARRIAVRTTRKYLHDKRQHDASVVSVGGDEADEGDHAPVSPRQRPADALPRHVREYLDQLPEAQREVIILHHALDHSVAEIAEMTGVSPDTVKSRLRLGIAALRKQVRQDIAVGPRGAP
jgi:RNA polymerase sigma-70 factor (ECF subfamily)